MKKGIIVGAIFLFCLTTLGGVYFWQKNLNNQTLKVSGLPNKERNLSSEARSVYSDRIKKAEDDLADTDLADIDSTLRQTNNHMYLAQQYFGLGELEKSKQEYLKVLSLDPKSEPALIGLALTYTEAGDLKAAENSLKTALDNNPKSYSVWIRYIDTKRVTNASNEEIKKIFEEALAATNRYPDVVTQAANFYEQIGDKQKSVDFWREAIKLNPTNKNAYELEIRRIETGK